MIRRFDAVLAGMLVLYAWTGQAALKLFPADPKGATGSATTESGGGGQTGVWVSGTVRQADGAPAAGVAVRVWRRGGQGGDTAYREVQADDGGRYRVALPEGAWRIAPCGSPAGYLPAYWDVTVEQGRVVAFQQVDRPGPEIRSVVPSVIAQGFRGGERIVLEGEGFGCSGRVRVELEDGRAFEVTELEEHTDERVRFRFPEIPGAGPADGAGFSFLAGPARAGPVWVGRVEPVRPTGEMQGAETLETGTELRQPAGGVVDDRPPPAGAGGLPGPRPGGGKTRKRP